MLFRSDQILILEGKLVVMQRSFTQHYWLGDNIFFFQNKDLESEWGGVIPVRETTDMFYKE